LEIRRLSESPALIVIVADVEDDKKRINQQQPMKQLEKKRFVNEAGAEQSVLNFEKNGVAKHDLK